MTIEEEVRVLMYACNDDESVEHFTHAVMAIVNKAALGERQRCAKILKTKASRLYLWVQKLPIGSQQRKELSLRCGELDQAGRDILGEEEILKGPEPKNDYQPHESSMVDEGDVTP